ncbi:MAG: thioredoxin family protein [Bacteroidia bacterium]|nr:thioredoxin family protein [Bacteroidia bacterium]
MKKISLVIFIFLTILYGCKSNKILSDNQTAFDKTETSMTPTDFHEASTWLLGYFTRRMMTRPPHSEWFQKGYDEYKFNEEAVNKLTEVRKEGLTIKIVMGSWCPDSRREVPRFIKILDYWKFPAENLIFIGVDESKYSPIGDYNKLEIVRVPTFIFYKNNVEAGRIIEVPVTSLEQDMVNILTRE